MYRESHVPSFIHPPCKKPSYFTSSLESFGRTFFSDKKRVQDSNDRWGTSSNGILFLSSSKTVNLGEVVMRKWILSKFGRADIHALCSGVLPRWSLTFNGTFTSFIRNFSTSRLSPIRQTKWTRFSPNWFRASKSYFSPSSSCSERNFSKFAPRRAVRISMLISASWYGSKYSACSKLKGSTLVFIFLFLSDIVMYVQGLRTGTEDSGEADLLGNVMKRKLLLLTDGEDDFEEALE